MTFEQVASSNPPPRGPSPRRPAHASPGTIRSARSRHWSGGSSASLPRATDLGTMSREPSGIARVRVDALMGGTSHGGSNR